MALLLGAGAACTNDEGTGSSMNPTDEGDGGLTSADGSTGDGSTDRPLDGRVSPPPDASTGGDAEACNRADLSFDPRKPTVYLLVDRSSSMFDNKLWEPLKAGVLAVMEELSRDVRFGFASYTGKNNGICPDMTEVEIAHDNYSAVAAAYQALSAPPYKGETPTALGLARVAEVLAADPDDGPKSIVLVTDGEPDFCDDGNVRCARDAVVAAAQAAHAQGINTFILSIGGQVDRAHLRDVANAGLGEGVVDHAGAVAQQCMPKATYASAEGQAPYFEPDVANRAALVDTLAGVVARTRSCVFDLEGRVRIDLNQASEGEVLIDDDRIPYGAEEGFRMNSPSELELRGSACERIRAKRAVRIAIDFPCEAVLVI